MHMHRLISIRNESHTFQEDDGKSCDILLIGNLFDSWRRHRYACEWNFFFFIWMCCCFSRCYVVCYLFLFNNFSFFLFALLCFGSILHSSIHFSHILTRVVFTIDVYFRPVYNQPICAICIEFPFTQFFPLFSPSPASEPKRKKIDFVCMNK